MPAEPEPEPEAAHVAEVPPAGPVPSGAYKSKTEIFRERMAELKQKEATKSGEAKAVAAAEDEVAAAAETPEDKPKKKGCFGMIVIGFGFIAAAGAAAARLHGWI